MNKLKIQVDELNKMILSGKIMDAFERYYDDDVVMQENSDEPTFGKDANRKREEEFVNSVTEFRGADVLHAATSENTSIVIWHYEYTHKDWGIRNYIQAAVQTWKDGKIIKEQFIYSN